MDNILKQKVGFKFLDYQYKEQMVWGIMKMDGQNIYVVNDPYKSDDRVHGNIYTEDDMDKIISRQEDFKHGLERRKQQEREEDERERQEQQRKLESENLYGFESGMSDMRRGKVLKILLKGIVYKNKYITRKDFIANKVGEGYHVEQRDNVVTSYGSKWDVKTSKPKTEYRLVGEGGLYYTITKTEFDFADFLIQNNIFKKSS